MAVKAWLLQIPLTRPYKLAFGMVTHLDSVVVQCETAHGEGFGEATLLTGYTDETIEETWDLTHDLVEAARTPSFDLDRALARLDLSHPFLTTAFRSALEMAEGSPRLLLDQPARVPILGLMQGEDEAALWAAADKLLGEGYKTLKLKVGFDAARDAELVQMAQRAVEGRARIRLDANQGYSAAQAGEFLSRISPEGIELFEQPCDKDDWAAHAKVVPVARERGIPLMLDESIYSEREIDRAAREGLAAFIKVKLMKLNTLARLEASIRHIRSLGMSPVLGNGVATDLSCWKEACIAARHIDNAGEMNGFLKVRQRLLKEPLAFHDGAIEIPARWRPRVDVAFLDRESLRQTYRRPAFFSGQRRQETLSGS